MANKHPLDGLMRWVQRETWREPLTDSAQRHLAPACEAAGVAVDDLAEHIGDHWVQVLWGCAFEDLISRTLDDGRNLAQAYLKQHGWKETGATRAYLSALRHSVPSLYEVSDIVLNEGFLLRDLVRGGEPLRVTERAATHSLVQWDRISTRVMTIQGKTVISGGVLVFERAAGDEALAAIGQAAGPNVAAPARDAVLANASCMFSRVWLHDALRSRLTPGPRELSNNDGDEMEFLTLHFPLAARVTQASIRAAFIGNKAVRQANARFWNWVDLEPGRHRQAAGPASGTSLITTMEDGAIVLGNIELKGRTLTLSVNSAARAARGRALIGALLEGMVREPRVERQTVEQMRAQKRSGDDNTEPDISADERRALIHQALTDHYTGVLDQPIPMLGGLSPRKAAQTAEGREKAIGWLKMIENHSAGLPADDPMADYDFGWMWRALGLQA